jgi:uncharacterized protein with FMN-binding domain
MKKALLSLALITASGTYVVYENHASQQPRQDSIAAATATVPPAPAPKPPVTKDAAVTSPAPLPPAGIAPSAFVVTTSPPAAAQIVAQASAGASAATSRPALVTIGSGSTSPTLASNPAIPLPLPRPASAPAAIQRAAAQIRARAATGYRDGTFQGVSANAYYGRVQVDALIQSGHLVKVDILDYPSDRRTSRSINSRALPELQQEAIQAQSANIDAVSGATLSSGAFVQSLDSALQQAKGGGNA